MAALATMNSLLVSLIRSSLIAKPLLLRLPGARSLDRRVDVPPASNLPMLLEIPAAATKCLICLTPPEAETSKVKFLGTISASSIVKLPFKFPTMNTLKTWSPASGLTLLPPESIELTTQQ